MSPPRLPSVDDADACEVPNDAEIVVVEDNEDSREILCELLELSGLKCRAAECGPAALQLLEQKRPDLMLIDLGLPGMDGFELARTVRSHPRGADICLIALTGYGQPSDREDSRAAGFDAHLVKPVHPDQLLALLSKLHRPPDSSSSVSRS